MEDELLKNQREGQDEKSQARIYEIPGKKIKDKENMRITRKILGQI